MTTLQTKLLPFKTSFKSEKIDEGLTLQEVYDRFVVAPIDGSSVFLTVNNQVVPKELWGELRTSDNMVVGIHAVPTGGGNGRKVTATIVQVLALAAAIYTGGAAAAAGFTLKGVGLAVATVGLSIAATMAYNAIYQVPVQSDLNRYTVKESKTQFISSGSNAIDKFGVIPVNLGTNRMFPKQAALPYTEANGKNNYLRQLFTYGYGKVLIEERKIGETSLSNYTDYDFEDFLNGDLNKNSRLYANRTYQENLSVTLSHAAGWIERRSQSDTNEIVVEILFQRGLCYYDNNGTKINRTVQFTIQTKKADESWSDLLVYHNAVSLQSITWGTFGGTEYHLQNDTLLGLNEGSGALQWFSSAVPNGWIQIGHLSKTSPNSFVYVDDRASLIGNKILNATDFQASGATYGYKAGSGILVISAGTILRNNGEPVVVTNATTEAFTVTKTFTFPEKGSYDVRISRITADSTSDQIIDEAVWSNLKSRYTAQKPVNQSDVSGTALFIKATDQLNGAIDRYNVVVSTVLDKGYSLFSYRSKIKIIDK